MGDALKTSERNYANRTEGYVLHTQMHLAKREMHRFFRTKQLWGSTICVGVILGIVGPFGTDEVLRFIPRLLYWLTHAMASFLLGTIGATWGAALSERLGWGMWPGILLGSCFGAVLVFCEVALVDLALFGPHRGAAELSVLALNIFGICVVLTTTLAVLASNADPRPAIPDHPALLSRLSPDKRGGLISVSVSDHYVEVTTTKGTEMILLRLSDAMKETAPVLGQQIHRSHWAALDQMTQLQRIDGKPHVLLSDGRTLPVSRSFMADVRKAKSW